MKCIHVRKSNEILNIQHLDQWYIPFKVKFGQGMKNITISESHLLGRWKFSCCTKKHYSTFSSVSIRDETTKAKLHKFILKHNLYPPKDMKAAFASDIGLELSDLNQLLKEYRSHLRREFVSTELNPRLKHDDNYKENSDENNRFDNAHESSNDSKVTKTKDLIHNLEIHRMLRQLVNNHLLKQKLNQTSFQSEFDNQDVELHKLHNNLLTTKTNNTGTTINEGNHEKIVDTLKRNKNLENELFLWKDLFPPHIIQSFSKEIGLSPLKVRRTIRKFITKGRVTVMKKQFLKDWLQENNISQEGKPNASQMEELIQILQLNRQQIHTLIDRFQDQYSKLTPEKSSLVSNYYKRFGMELVHDTFILKEVMEATGLGKHQIRNLVFRLKDGHEYHQKEQISKDIIEKIHQILREQNFEKPKGAQLRDLRKRFAINRIQLNNLIHRIIHFKSGNITESTFQEIQAWSSNHNRRPTKEEFNNFAQKYGLGINQVYALFRRAQDDANGEITTEKKELVQKYIADKGKNFDIEELKKLAQLNSSQIHSIIHRIKNPRGEITEDVKKYIQEEMNHYNMNDSSDLEILVTKIHKNSNLSKQQIRELIQRLRFPPREMTSQKKTNLIVYLKCHFSEDVTKWPKTLSEVESLQNEFDLSSLQILRIIRTYKKNKNITFSC